MNVARRLGEGEAGLLVKSRQEGREITDDELDELVEADDAKSAQLDAEILRQKTGRP